jgi:hypothetical protein
MRLCINCQTENPDDAVFCSDCGMSLMAAPTGEEALKLKEQVEPQTHSPTTQGVRSRHAVDKKRDCLLAVGLLAMGLWSIVVCALGYFMGLVISFLMANGAPMPNQAEVQRRAELAAYGTWIAALALAAAPWLIAGVASGVRRWRSRRSAGPKDVE